MTVPITGSVKDVTGVEDNDTPWSFASVIRFAEDGSVITEKPREVRAVSGNLKVNLVPGYAIVTYGKHVWQVDVPETPTTLKALIEAGVAFPPDASQALLDAAVGQYVEANREQFRTRAVPVVGDPTMAQWVDENGALVGDPVPWSQVISEEIAQAAVEAEAPTAVDADLAGRDLAVERVIDSVQFKLGGMPIGDPLDFDLNVPFADPSAVKTSAYSAAANELVPADASAGGFTVTLPSAPPNFTIVVVKKIDTTNNAVTVQRSGTDVFNTSGGPTSAQMVIPGQSLWFQYKAGIWYVLGHGTPLDSMDSRYFLNQQDIPDPNGNTAIRLAGAASAVNYLWLFNAAAGGQILMRASGLSDNIGIGMRPKGNEGNYLFESGGAVIAVFAPSGGTSVNFHRFQNATAGNPIRFLAGGTDTDISYDVIPKNNGWLKINGAKVALQDTAQFISGATLTPNASLYDTWVHTAMAVPLTVNAPTGTLRDGKRYTFRFKDNGTGRGITWNAFYRAVGITLPATTVASKVLYVSGYYNAADNKLDMTDVKQEA